MTKNSSLSKKRVSTILSGEEKGRIIFSENPLSSEILIFPLCTNRNCCFTGKHQYNLIKDFIPIQFPYKCRDIYNRTILKTNPDDLGKTEEKWQFPCYEENIILLPSKEEKFTILDGGCSFIKCFFEFYNWDFEKINFSYIKNFAVMLIQKMEKLIHIARKHNFDAIFLQDEFGYYAPWFSIEFFKEELLPIYFKLANLIHKNGLLFFLHSCGKVEEIFSLLKGYVDVWHKGDWQDEAEIISTVNNPHLPTIFIDLTEVPFSSLSPGDLLRNHILTIR